MDFRLLLRRENVESALEFFATVGDDASQPFESADFTDGLLTMHEFTKESAEVTFGGVVDNDGLQAFSLCSEDFQRLLGLGEVEP